MVWVSEKLDIFGHFYWTRFKSSPVSTSFDNELIESKIGENGTFNLSLPWLPLHPSLQFWIHLAYPKAYLLCCWSESYQLGSIKRKNQSKGIWHQPTAWRKYSKKSFKGSEEGFSESFDVRTWISLQKSNLMSVFFTKGFFWFFYIAGYKDIKKVKFSW